MPTTAASRLVRVWVVLLGALALLAGPEARADDEVKATVSVFPEKIAPGGRGVLITTFELEHPWHIYPNNPTAPKELGVEPTPTLVEPAETKGLAFRAGQWPAPIEVTVNFTGRPLKIPAYEGVVRVYTPFTVAADATAGEMALTVSLSWGACDDRNCLPPGGREVEAKFTVEGGAAAGDFASLKGFDPAGFDSAVRAATARGPDSIGATAQGEAKPVAPASGQSGDVVHFDAFGLSFDVDTRGLGGTVLILLIAVLAGFILNLTPCVLPVIPIKIISLQKASADPRKTKVLGIAMSLGVVGFWLVLGLLIVVLKAFEATSTLFGTGWFQACIAVFILVMAIGMMGAFTVQVPQAVYAVNPRLDNLGGSFLFGVLTAILGTPCFGPFAGSAIAWATQQPSWVGISAFTALGLGMALPYLVLAFKPGWVDFVPRTGPASELVKQVMGLLLLATAAWFMGTAIVTLIAETPYLARVLHWWVIAAFCTAAGVWLAARTFMITRKPGRLAVISLLSIALAGASIWTTVTLTRSARLVYLSKHLWREYEVAAFEKARADGKTVVVDFTAIWCLNCQGLKAAVLTRPDVVRELDDQSVVSFEVNLDSLKAPGWKLLSELGRRDIPLLAIFPPGASSPSFQSDAYTIGQVVAALQDAKGKKVASNEGGRGRAGVTGGR